MKVTETKSESKGGGEASEAAPEPKPAEPSEAPDAKPAEAPGGKPQLSGLLDPTDCDGL